MSNTNLHELLQLEVAKKSKASNISFIAFAFFVFFYGLGLTHYLYIIKIFSIIIILNGIARHLLTEKIFKHQFLSKTNWIILCTCIAINAICWSCILNLASLELKLEGSHFMVVTTMITGFVGASIVSLSFFSFLFISFQILMLLPQIGIILYLYKYENLNHLPLIFLYAIYFIFQLKLHKIHQNSFIQLFKYQMRLVKKNNDLEKSQNDLVHSTLSLIHASRLSLLGEMSASIAHEINNPITIMNTSSTLLKKEILNDTPNKETLNKHLDTIIKSCERVIKIVKGLKNLSYKTDKTPMEKSYITPIIDETIFFCKELMYEKNIQLIIEPIPEVIIICHNVQISQVLLNLIKNAIDYLSAETPLDNRWIKIFFVITKEQIHINIQNSGTKIPDSIAAKIFEPFFTTKPNSKGTGLGLSLSKNIMTEHGGNLALDSITPHTTFVVTLPLNKL